MRASLFIMAGALCAIISVKFLGARHGSACDHGPGGNASGHKGAVATDSTAVRVESRREGNQTQFVVVNSERSEVTMTFDFALVNMKGSVTFPHTATFGPGESEAFVLEPDVQGNPWQFSYTNYYKLGSHVAEHEDSFVYLLPYSPGSSYKVTQGYNGSFSHKGSNQYAIDWKMPEGTIVHAARGGVVVKKKDDSHLGGPSVKYDPHNNYVLIRHDDGTLGHYCHLQKGGVLVAPGQRVGTGEPIALSGNTGFSSGAHLHFAVFKTLDGRQRVSIPVRFMSSDGRPVTLAEGRRYRAPQMEAREIQSARGPDIEEPAAVLQ